MWRRTYLLLLLIRVYFALSPSYLHPDENFQGPEVFAGMTPPNHIAITPPLIELNGRCDALKVPSDATKIQSSIADR